MPIGMALRFWKNPIDRQVRLIPEEEVADHTALAILGAGIGVVQLVAAVALFIGCIFVGLVVGAVPAAILKAMLGPASQTPDVVGGLAGFGVFLGCAIWLFRRRHAIMNAVCNGFLRLLILALKLFIGLLCLIAALAVLGFFLAPVLSKAAT